MKILLTVAIAVGWLLAMQMNLMGAAKDANRASGRNVLLTTIGFSILVTVMAVYGLIKLWR